MEYELHSHRHALAIVKEPVFKPGWKDFCAALDSITDEHVIEQFEKGKRRAKSISEAVNHLIRDCLVKRGWDSQSHIFGDERFKDKRWTLDFAKPGDDILGKGGFSVEIAFNHGEATAWNLLKPVLASELNHVAKEIQTEVGIVVMATEELKAKGGLDSATGTFEKTLGYLKAMHNVLSVPIVLVGLKAPKSFYIQHSPTVGKKIGTIVRI